MPVAIFDLDGTLIPAPSCERRFLSHLLARRHVGLPQFLSAAGYAVRHASRYGRQVFKTNKAYAAGLSLKDLSAIAEDFVQEEIAPRLRPRVVARLAMHRENADSVALLSGAPAFIVKPLAEHLGVDTWRGTRFAMAEGRFLAAAPSEHPFGTGKITFAKEICADLGGDLATASAYADSIHDLPLLAGVGRPVAVDPDAGLRRVAQASGWELLHSADPGEPKARMIWRPSG